MPTKDEVRKIVTARRARYFAAKAKAAAPVKAPAKVETAAAPAAIEVTPA